MSEWDQFRTVDDDWSQFRSVETPVRSKDEATRAFGSMPEGVRLHLRRQAVGGQQIGSDIGRFVSGEMGQEYSPYRKELERRRLELERETKEAPLGTRLGDISAGALEFGAIPMPMKGGTLSRSVS